jgi:predicted metal-dependent peptidase
MNHPKLDKARTLISKDQKYVPITGLLLSREDVITIVGLPYPTAASDGVRHYWHPHYIESQSIDELRKTKLHELGHDWLYHTDGRGKALMDKHGQELASIALDHAVNNFLADCGETFDDSWLCDRKYKGWSAEEIAFDLAKNQPPRPKRPRSGSGGGGGHEIMINATPQDQAKAREATEQALASATLMDAIKASNGLENDPSEGQGSNAMASMLEAARANRQPFVDWKLELQDFCGSARTDERTSTYSRVCRRPVPNLIRPGKKREGKPHIGVILDTSGSMYTTLPKLMVELEAMSQDGFSFDVLCTDGKVYGPFAFASGDFDVRDLPLQGGGGSDMQPAFEKASELINVDALVFCTDGDVNWPSLDHLSQLPPCLLIETDRAKKSTVLGFYKHLLMR